MIYEEDENVNSGSSNRMFGLLLFGIALVFVGIIVVVIALFFSGASGSVGGVILIGPIPIIFGAGPDSILLILIGVIVTVISIVLFWIISQRAKRGNS